MNVAPKPEHVRQRARELLASGCGETETARLCGVNQSTIHRWMARPEFKAKLDAMYEERLDAAQGKMVGLLGSAVDRLAEAMNNPDAPLDIVVKCAMGIVDRALAIGSERRAARAAKNAGPVDDAKLREQLRALRLARPHLFDGLDEPESK